MIDHYDLEGYIDDQHKGVKDPEQYDIGIDFLKAFISDQLTGTGDYMGPGHHQWYDPEELADLIPYRIRTYHFIQVLIDRRKPDCGSRRTDGAYIHV
jgi:hypothetical protein